MTDILKGLCRIVASLSEKDFVTTGVLLG
jgi:hypothetical protein